MERLFRSVRQFDVRWGKEKGGGERRRDGVTDLRYSTDRPVALQRWFASKRGRRIRRTMLRFLHLYTYGMRMRISRRYIFEIKDVP